MTPRELLTATYRAFNARDVDAVLADQVVQHVYALRDGFITHMEIRKP